MITSMLPIITISTTNPKKLLFSRPLKLESLSKEDAGANEIINHLTITCERTVLHVFSTTKVHPHRLIYGVTGLVFRPCSPKPFGGPKAKPGYRLLVGHTSNGLLTVIIKETIQQLIRMKEAGAIEALVAAVNKVMELQAAGARDQLNELVMKGIQKSGHIEWRKVGSLPEYLRHVDEGVGIERRDDCVEFTPTNIRHEFMRNKYPQY
ncbi:hypothetical protein BDR26DRAFT_430211 [Obelidium mucronatum]|nr:hypothetical protein BDR26DRAFT_430211 [Obelidium mucronatum]